MAEERAEYEVFQAEQVRALLSKQGKVWTLRALDFLPFNMCVVL